VINYLFLIKLSGKILNLSEMATGVRRINYIVAYEDILVANRLFKQYLNLTLVDSKNLKNYLKNFYTIQQ